MSKQTKDTEQKASSQEELKTEHQETGQAPDETKIEATEASDASVDELTEIQEELSEMKDKYLRKVAEFDNFRKRSIRERSELIKTASEHLVVSLLEVMDDIERAQAQMEKSDDLASLKQGVTLIFDKFKNTLTAKGLTRMEAIGEVFDPELHEAVANIPAPDKKSKGKIVDETQPGYYLNEKIIRHAKVVVAQ